MIAWFTRNGVAANLLMVSILFAGFIAATRSIPTEVFPEFELDVIEIGVEYRGSTPSEVEEAVVIRIEEAIQDLEGIKQITSSSAEGAGAVSVEVEKGYEARELLEDIKNRVDAINTFPDETENPTVRIAQRSGAVITVVLSGNLAEADLRTLGEHVRDEIADLPKVTQVSLGAVRRYEIAIEVSEQTLQQYGLTLDEVARAISSSSIDLPAGNIKTSAGEVLLRTKGQAYVGKDFEEIVLITREDGTRITVGDIADVRDGFEEEPLVATYNGTPCVMINVSRVGDQNAIELANIVKEYMAQAGSKLPPGVELSFWNDRSKIVKGRLDVLIKSAWQGAILVVVLLALFLRPAVSLWVFLGIPVSFAGAVALMPLVGATFNIFSLFAFILVLGIVVDDAIVTGENIFIHLQKGTDGTKAAIEGAEEVAMPVTFGVLTTIAAFVPLLMIEGTRGKIFAQIPMIVIPVLFFSLIESKWILPAHLKHLSTGRKETDDLNILSRFQRFFADGLEWVVRTIYAPCLEMASRHRYITLSVFICSAFIVLGLVEGERIRFNYFPRVASETATASLQMPLGTPFEITDGHVLRIRDAARALQAKYTDAETGNPLIQNIIAVAGSSGVTRGGGPRGGSGVTGQSHVGEVSFRIMPPEEKENLLKDPELINKDNNDLVNEWRTMIGPIPGAKELNFRAEIGRGGNPIDIALMSQSFTDLDKVAKATKAKLETYQGVFDITDTFEDGKQEVKLDIKPEAELLGITMTDLARQARMAFFGQEAQRIQRGREDIRVMVRYPEEERRSLANLESMNIRTQDGMEVPISAVADMRMGRSFSTIRRIDRNRVIRVSADADKESVNLSAIEDELRAFLQEETAKYAGMKFEFEGEAQERADSFGSLQVGGLFLLFVIYAMLAIPFKSYLQPAIVMSVIPFGLMGAVLGHMVMGMPLSIMSIFGMLALSGVVVNDSLVMVDYINRRSKTKNEIIDAVRSAGSARFRPILLTSLTTFAGLIPLLFEKSTQAQFLIPMAVSLGFGILFATLITLFLVPINYLVLEDIKDVIRWMWNFQPGAKRPKPELKH